MDHRILEMEGTLENIPVQPPNFTDEETKAQERQTHFLNVTTPNQGPGETSQVS